MALVFKPHTWSVSTAFRPVVAGKTMTPVYGAPRTIHGQISGVSSEYAYRKYNVEVRRGFEVLVDVTEVQYHAQGSRLLFGPLTLVVMMEPRILDHGLLADHASLIAEEVRNDA